MEEKLISIIIPIYNSEEYLEKCLMSVINQTYKNLEIILVNDGSKDGSRIICEKFKQNDDRIILINKENNGSSAARNIGLKICKGKYIVFLDSDDWLDLNTCESAVNEMENNELDVVMWGYIREFNDKSIKKKIYSKNIYFDENGCKEIRRKLIGPIGAELKKPEQIDVLCPVCMKLYRSNLIKENRIEFFNIKEVGTYEDGLFNIEVFKKAKRAKFINKDFYHYRKTNKNSITTKYKKNFLEKWEKLFIYMKKKCSSELEYEALDNRIAISTLGLGLNIIQSDLQEKEKIKKIKEILNKKFIVEVYNDFNFVFLSEKWKVFYFACKNKKYIRVYVLLSIAKFLKGRI